MGGKLLRGRYRKAWDSDSQDASRETCSLQKLGNWILEDNCCIPSSGPCQLHMFRSHSIPCSGTLLSSSVSICEYAASQQDPRTCCIPASKIPAWVQLAWAYAGRRAMRRHGIACGHGSCNPWPDMRTCNPCPACLHMACLFGIEQALRGMYCRICVLSQGAVACTCLVVHPGL